MFGKLKAQAKSAAGQGKAAVNSHQFKEGADAAADKLRASMQGTGTNEDDIIEVLTNHANWQILQISEVYTKKFDRDLIKDLKTELTGNLETLCVALCRPAAFLDAHFLKDATKGAGTNEELLIEILCTRDAGAMKAVEESYFSVHGNRLVDDIKDDTSGDFEKFLVGLVEGERDENSKPDFEKAQEDARDLFMAGEGKKLGTDEKTFIDIFTKRSFRQLKAIAACYSMISNNDLAKAVKKEFSKNLEKGLLTILEYARTPGSFWANKLKKAMKGLGTNDSVMIRIFVGRREIDLPQIADDFARINEKTLFKWVKDDLSGDYEKAMISIMRNCKITKPNHAG